MCLKQERANDRTETARSVTHPRLPPRLQPLPKYLKAATSLLLDTLTYPYARCLHCTTQFTNTVPATAACSRLATLCPDPHAQKTVSNRNQISFVARKHIPLRICRLVTCVATTTSGRNCLPASAPNSTPTNSTRMLIAWHPDSTGTAPLRPCDPSQPDPTLPPPPAHRAPPPLFLAPPPQNRRSSSMPSRRRGAHHATRRAAPRLPGSARSSA